MNNFRTLDLATEFCEKTEKLKIRGHLRDQLLRASSSVALSLSEGNAKYTVDEMKRFYQIAYASSKECQTILNLLAIKDKEVQKMADHLGACIYRLMKSDIKILNSEKPNTEY